MNPVPEAITIPKAAIAEPPKEREPITALPNQSFAHPKVQSPFWKLVKFNLKARKPPKSAPKIHPRRKRKIPRYY